MISRNDPCWCGSKNKWKKCHFPEEAPINSDELSSRYEKQYGIILKSKSQIDGIRKACQLAAFILEETCKRAKAGATTNELSDYAYELHKKYGAIPAPLGYGSPPFPKPICTSLNEVICHGIPNDTPLKEGDILNIDITCILGGYYGDCSRMVMIGKVSDENKHLVEVARECLHRAITILKPGLLLSDIGKCIQDYATSEGCSVVNTFVGHGVGLKFHEPPHVPHCYNQSKIPLAEGMIFTIEPMINAGVRESIVDPIDKWTARTADGKSSAQWEHTVLITKDGYEILTLVGEKLP